MNAMYFSLHWQWRGFQKFESYFLNKQQIDRPITNNNLPVSPVSGVPKMQSSPETCKDDNIINKFPSATRDKHLQSEAVNSQHLQT